MQAGEEDVIVIEGHAALICPACTYSNPSAVSKCALCGAALASAASATRTPIVLPTGSHRATPAALTAAEARAPTSTLADIDWLRLPAAHSLRSDPRFLHGTLYSPLSQASISSYFSAAAAAPPTAAPAAPAPRAISPGVVHLPAFLTLDQCHALLHAVDAVTARSPLCIPRVIHPYEGTPAWANLFMAPCGMQWDGVEKRYSRMAPCAVPPTLLDLARAAMASATAAGAFAAADLPAPEDFDVPQLWTALANLYPPAWGTISAHRDSSEPSLTATPPRHYPVVSLSVGNAVDFKLWPEWRGDGEPGPELTVTLRSGDALVFGGAGRLVRHAIPGTCGSGARPARLKMVPGRLNVTIRRL